MKKRLFSLFLCAAMLCGLVPAAAMAVKNESEAPVESLYTEIANTEDSASSELALPAGEDRLNVTVTAPQNTGGNEGNPGGPEQGPQLMLRWLNQNEQGYVPGPDLNSCFVAAPGEYPVALYLGEGNPENLIQDESKLSLVGENADQKFEIRKIDGRTGFYFIHAKKFGGAKLCFTAGDGSTFEMNLECSLPEVGYYRQPTAAVEHFVGEYQGEETLYLCPRDGVQLTAAKLHISQEVAEYVTLDKTNLPGYATITIRRGFTGGFNLNIEVSGTEGENSSFSGRYCELQIDSSSGGNEGDTNKPEQGPQLKLRWLNRKGQDFEFASDFNNCFVEAPGEYFVALYLGEELIQNEKQLSLVGENADQKFEIHKIDGNPGYYFIHAKAFGSATLRFTAEDSNTFDMNLECSLPEIGYYTQPEVSEANFVNAIPYEGGKTVYLCPKKGITITGAEFAHEGVDQLVILNKDYLAECGYIIVTLNPGFEGGGFNLVLSVSGTVGGNQSFTGKFCRLTVGNPDPVPGPGHMEFPTVTYNDKEYILGLSLYEGGRFEVMPDGGGFNGANYGDAPGFTQRVLIGAVSNDEDAAEAPQKFFDLIDNVSIQITDWNDFVTPKDGQAHNFNQTDSKLGTTKDTRYKIGALYVPGAIFHADEGQYGAANIETSFRVKLPGQDPQTFTVHNRIHYMGYCEFVLDAQAPNVRQTVNTAEKLNQVLGNDKALLGWFSDNFPKEYADFENIKAIPESNYGIAVKLPALTYDDVVEVSPELMPIVLLGSEVTGESGERVVTTLPGLRIGNNFDAVEDMAFAAREGVTQKVDKNDANETCFTCGILCVDTNYGKYNENGNAVAHNCTFTGFDYGIRTTFSGYYLPRDRCDFVDCTVGLYIDSNGTNRANWDNAIMLNRFMGCDTAVKIVSLPQDEDHTPYKIRVYGCDFLNNVCDMDVTPEGTYYFYANYYGTVKDGEEAVTKENVTSAVAKVHEGHDVTVVTNPRRINLCRGDGPQGVDPQMFKLWNRLQNQPGPAPGGLMICVNPSLHTQILNSMADILVIDGFCCHEECYDGDDLEFDLELDILDGAENILGKWEF